jgi:hypothetical protein
MTKMAEERKSAFNDWFFCCLVDLKQRKKTMYKNRRMKSSKRLTTGSFEWLYVLLFIVYWIVAGKHGNGRLPAKCQCRRQAVEIEQLKQCQIEAVQDRLALEKMIDLLRAQVHQQELEINRFKEEIDRAAALPGKLYDGLEWIASGCGAMQNRLGEIHQLRPGDGERYLGL